MGDKTITIDAEGQKRIYEAVKALNAVNRLKFASISNSSYQIFLEATSNLFFYILEQNPEFNHED